jgi:hypothetical protein
VTSTPRRSHKLIGSEVAESNETTDLSLLLEPGILFRSVRLNCITAASFVVANSTIVLRHERHRRLWRYSAGKLERVGGGIRASRRREKSVCVTIETTPETSIPKICEGECHDQWQRHGSFNDGHRWRMKLTDREDEEWKSVRSRTSTTQS